MSQASEARKAAKAEKTERETVVVTSEDVGEVPSELLSEPVAEVSEAPIATELVPVFSASTPDPFEPFVMMTVPVVEVEPAVTPVEDVFGVRADVAYWNRP